jgi:hypothetical protein
MLRFGITAWLISIRFARRFDARYAVPRLPGNMGLSAWLNFRPAERSSLSSRLRAKFPAQDCLLSLYDLAEPARLVNYSPVDKIFVPKVIYMQVNPRQICAARGCSDGITPNFASRRIFIGIRCVISSRAPLSPSQAPRSVLAQVFTDAGVEFSNTTAFG